ncbi:MAG: hypothetical protein CM1200mP24_04840 [Gammaproteobacteria bacterium]|nr:MAG: hypothetical protein CM1200mP24_04840 [Gammaproteobacteria bacterium]
MRSAIANANVGDDVYREDLSIKHLEEKAADLLGHEAGLLFQWDSIKSVRLLTHCGEGRIYCWTNAHTYRFEAGGAASLGGIQPQPIPFPKRRNPRCQRDRKRYKAR